jgi:hypothetical protein
MTVSVDIAEDELVDWSKLVAPSHSKDL